MDPLNFAAHSPLLASSSSSSTGSWPVPASMASAAAYTDPSARPQRAQHQQRPTSPQALRQQPAAGGHQASSSSSTILFDPAYRMHLHFASANALSITASPGFASNVSVSSLNPLDSSTPSAQGSRPTSTTQRRQQHPITQMPTPSATAPPRPTHHNHHNHHQPSFHHRVSQRPAAPPSASASASATAATSSLPTPFTSANRGSPSSQLPQVSSAQHRSSPVTQDLAQWTNLSIQHVHQLISRSVPHHAPSTSNTPSHPPNTSSDQPSSSSSHQPQRAARPHFDHFALLHSQAASIIERRRHLLRNWESMSSRTPSTADPPTDLGLRYSEGLFSMSRAHRRTTSGETDSDWDYQDDDDDDDDEDANRQMLQEIRGSFTCQRVASRAAILSLESVDANSLSKEERTCAICYNDYGEESPEGLRESPLRLPQCKHVFGDHCIKKWFEDSDSCPYCRDKVPSETKHYTTSATTIRNMLRMRGWDQSRPEVVHDIMRRIAMGERIGIRHTRDASQFIPILPERRTRPAEDEGSQQRRTRQRLSSADTDTRANGSTATFDATTPPRNPRSAASTPTAPAHSTAASTPRVALFTPAESPSTRQTTPSITSPASHSLSPNARINYALRRVILQPVSPSRVYANRQTLPLQRPISTNSIMPSMFTDSSTQTPDSPTRARGSGSN